MPFPCSKCGECCRHIDKIPQLAAFDTGNGICIHLKNNLCNIYDHRPEICNVEAMYEKYFAGRFTREEFYAMNLKICKKIVKIE